MKKGKLKAYIVTNKWGDIGSIVIWAESSGKAKAAALYKDELDGTDYIDIRVNRAPDFDKYAESKQVPIQELLNIGWWFRCSGLCGREISQDDIDEKEAYIIFYQKDFNSFVKGDVICAECMKKLEERGHVDR